MSNLHIDKTKPAPVIGLMVTRPQLERLIFQVNARLAFGSDIELGEAIEMEAVYKNDDEGIDYRWNPEFVATCTDKNLADFLLASVHSDELMTEEEAIAEAKGEKSVH